MKHWKVLLYTIYICVFQLQIITRRPNYYVNFSFANVEPTWIIV